MATVTEAEQREMRNIQSDDPVTKLVAWHRLTRFGLARIECRGGHFLAFELTDAGRAALAEER